MDYETEPTTDAPTDLRFSISLYAEVVSAMERHGYVQPTGADRNRSTADTLLTLRHLVRAFEGEAN